MARLILATAEGVQAIDLRPTNSLGRHPSNSIQLLDKIVSKEHCTVEQREHGFWLRDLGSLNGTFINGERVRGEQTLRHGDEIALGSTRARYDDGSGGPLPPPAVGPGAVASGGGMQAMPGSRLPPSAHPHSQPGQGIPGIHGGMNPSGPASAQRVPSMVPSAHISSSGIPIHGSGHQPGGHQPGIMPGSAPAHAMHGHPQAPSHGVGAVGGAAALGNLAIGFPQSGNLGPSSGHGPGTQAMRQHPPIAANPSVGMPAPGMGSPGMGSPPGHPQSPYGAAPNPQPNLGMLSGGHAAPGVAIQGVSGGPAAGHGWGGRPHSGTRVDMLDSARAIERQIAARSKGFAPFDQVANDPSQLRLDYERLRITWELARDIGLERDLDRLLEKILNAIFRFVKADRGVILLKEPDGTLVAKATKRRDGTEAPIEVSSTILNHVIREKASVLTHDASTDFAASKGKSMILNRISSAMVVPLIHDQDVLGALWLDSQALAQFQQKDLEVVTTVTNQAAMFVENNLLARKVEQEIITRERFSRLLSPNVAEQVVSGKLEIKKGGVHVDECTVFNSDIRGFTRMSEGTTAEVMIEVLNEYFEQMVDTIFKYEGTLDKFMGDGIMAIWGAPAVHPDDPVRSVQCALEQLEILGRFNRKRVELGELPLAIGIGLHTGPLVAGYVGSSRALSYTVIGDTVNTSARLCGVAQAGQILVSENTLARLGNRFEVEELPATSLKGKEKPLRVFNIKREKPTVPRP